jgi:uncharacterized protein YcfJ
MRRHLQINFFKGKIVKYKTLAFALIASFVTIASAQEVVQYDYARVVNVDPILKTGFNTVPRQSCTTIMQVGTNQEKQSCTTYHDKMYYTTPIGYNVTIEYDGELRTVKLAKEPAMRVPIKVVKRIFVIE